MHTHMCTTDYHSNLTAGEQNLIVSCPGPRKRGAQETADRDKS